MPEGYLIYQYIKSIISDISGIESCTYNDIQEEKEKVIGINISKPQVVSKRKLNTGEALYRQALVTVSINCERTKEGMLKGEGYLEELRNRSEKIHNKNVYFNESVLSDNTNYTDFLNIGQIDPLSDIINLGKNTFGIPSYSIRLRINYIKGGN
jgi:hypothetical protein